MRFAHDSGRALARARGHTAAHRTAWHAAIGVTTGGLLVAACTNSTAPRDAAMSGAATRSATSQSGTVAPAYPLVSIQSAPATLTVGQQAKLTAQLSEPGEGTWSGHNVTWTSSDPSVISVSTTAVGALAGDTGVLTAKAAGSATITATTQSNTSQTKTISVTGGSASGGTGGTGGNGGALVACVAANLVSWDFTGGGWGPLDHVNFGSSGHIVSDPTAPSGYAEQFNWTTSSGDEGGQVNAIFPSRQFAYVRFGYKQSSAFPNGGIKKILRYRASGYNQLLGTLDIDGDKYIWFYDDLDSQHVWYQTAGPSPSAVRGSWHWFEVYNDISVSGNLVFKVWLDGTLIISGTDAVSNQGLSFGIASPGGTFNAPAGTGSDWVTSIGVSSGCVNAPW